MFVYGIFVYIYVYDIYGCFSGIQWGDKKFPCHVTFNMIIQVRDCRADQVPGTPGSGKVRAKRMAICQLHCCFVAMRVSGRLFDDRCGDECARSEHHHRQSGCGFALAPCPRSKIRARAKGWVYQFKARPQIEGRQRRGRAGRTPVNFCDWDDASGVQSADVCTECRCVYIPFYRHAEDRRGPTNRYPPLDSRAIECSSLVHACSKSQVNTSDLFETNQATAKY